MFPLLLTCLHRPGRLATLVLSSSGEFHALDLICHFNFSTRDSSRFRVDFIIPHVPALDPPICNVPRSFTSSMRRPFTPIGEFGVFGLFGGVLLDSAFFSVGFASIRSLCAACACTMHPRGFRASLAPAFLCFHQVS